MNNVAELLRLINNLIKTGTIAEIDHEGPRVRVRSGDLLTNWIPWCERRAGATRDWDPPTIGEQVILLSPGGDPASAVVLCSINSAANPPPVNAANLTHRLYPDGAVIEYDHEAHHLRAVLPGSAEVTADGAVSVTAQGAIDIESAADISITAAGYITLSGARIDLN